MGYATLTEQFLARVDSNPTFPCVELLFADRPSRRLTYGDLLAHAGRYANHLRDQSIRPGDVVAVILDHGADLLGAIWGTLLCGAVPSVFAFPSSKVPPDVYLAHVRHQLATCQSSTVITQLKFVEGLAPLRSDEPAIKWVHADQLPASASKNASYVHRQSRDVAFLQHTSGTTRLRKGIALSHGAALNQLEHYVAALQLTPADRIASWLPLYHDMGFVACFLLPILRGIPLVMMSPFEWLADPLKFLAAIQSFKATLCWQPNFAYNVLAMRATPDLLRSMALDLSAVRAFISCAEPIQAGSLDHFFERFKAQGLRSSALSTSYALAENTFAVTQTPPGQAARIDTVDARRFTRERKAVAPTEEDAPARRVVSSGTSLVNNRVKIVDSRRAVLPERSLGEIAIQSDSLMEGYAGDPETTQRALVDGWFYTGDEGYLADGHLFVTGRLNDMIIVAGKNIYPEDVESIVSQVPGIKPGRVAGFGLFNDALGTEDLVIVAETEETDPVARRQITADVSQHVSYAIDCSPADVLLTPPGWLLKSSSGKISRAANKTKYLETLSSGVPDES